MIIKKYLGKTEEVAVEAAKKELGNDIVIMNVRNIKSKGLFSSFRPKVVEITVALEEMERNQPMNRTINVQQQLQDNSQTYKTLSEAQDSSKNIEEKLDSLQTLLVSQFQKAESEKSEVKEEKIDTEVEEVIDEKDAERIMFLKLLYNTMIDNEIDEQYANLILEDIDKICKPNIPFDNTLMNIYQKMILKFGKAEGITPAKKGPRIVIFIGPTGVGKTTTIAKIASNFVVEEKKKVVLLTADTYRIAAAEQLRTYANILEVPFRVIYTQEEMQGAIKDFNDFDYIFVDTAGHSHQNEEQVNKTTQLLQSVDDVAEKQIFLVLSATTKYNDLIRISDSYEEIGEYNLIFTKLDETSSFGNLLNIKLHTNSSIAYVTFGQNVPDDIEVFNPQKTVKQLLGGKR